MAGKKGKRYDASKYRRPSGLQFYVGGLEMRLKPASIIALIGSIFIAFNQLFQVAATHLWIDWSAIENAIVWYEGSGILSIIGWLTIINFFISFLLAQRKRGN